MMKECIANDYYIREVYLDAVACDAAIYQQRWVTCCMRVDASGIQLPDLDDMGLWLMKNLLMPPELEPHQKWLQHIETHPTKDEFPNGACGTHRTLNVLDPSQCHVIGHIYDDTAHIPLDSRAYTSNPKQGIQQLLKEEWAKGLGIQKKWDLAAVPMKQLWGTTCNHIWAALEAVIS